MALNLTQGHLDICVNFGGFCTVDGTSAFARVVSALVRRLGVKTVSLGWLAGVTHGYTHVGDLGSSLPSDRMATFWYTTSHKNVSSTSMDEM